jgi:hypothetical protein
MARTRSPKPRTEDPIVAPAVETVTVTPLALSIAQTAIHGGVVEQVIRLLTGGGVPADGEGRVHRVTRVVRVEAREEQAGWDGGSREPESSDPTTTSSEDDGELSRLMAQVRGRRTSPRRRRTPASS